MGRECVQRAFDAHIDKPPEEQNTHTQCAQRVQTHVVDTLDTQTHADKGARDHA